MNQSLHILRKGLFHHWPEIVISIALLGTYVWQTSRLGPGVELAVGPFFFLGSLPQLLVVAWIFLIVRVVQAESLVGNRQFWVTRPYQWKSLLAAKVVFILGCVNIPLLISQCWLLTQAGFPVSSHLMGLFWLQMEWVLILDLTMLTLATVTRNLGHFILALLFVVLFLIAGASLDSIPPNANVAPDSFLDTLQPALVAAVAVAVILWQYSRRRTAYSRIALVSAPLLCLIILLFTPYRLLIERAFPLPSGNQTMPVQLAFNPAKPSFKDEGRLPDKKKTEVLIPLLVSGIPNNSYVEINGVKATISGAGVTQWTSAWQPIHVTLYPDGPRSRVHLKIDRVLFDHIKDAPSMVEISFALTFYEGGEQTRVIAEARGFSMPNEGRCSFAPALSNPNQISCSFPLKRPFLLVSAKATELNCSSSDRASSIPSGAAAYAVISGNGPAEFGISPIPTDRLYFAELSADGEKTSFQQEACPGMSLTISALHLAKRFRSDLRIEAIRLADYQLPVLAPWGFGTIRRR
jgi:hypothetical protein